LQELIHRERATEFQKFAYLGRIIGAAFGVDTSRLARAEEMLAATIFQTMHDPQSMRRSMEELARKAHEEREARLRDARILAKTASYSADAEEKETSEAFTASLNRRRRK